ncbi:alkaline shock response membrane anchor protein AmaP [Streptosporangium sp. KLBMP 9127]|nr:alkaline shock response membrane anchor protein AmaP [Streptosporangium sp. KLBMP 9127]
MERKTARGNRLGLALLGLLLFVVGGLSLARALGAFGRLASMERVVGLREIVFFARNPWMWWVLAALGLIAAILGLRWLLAQARNDTVRGLRLSEDATGITEVESGGVAEALEADLTGHPSILRAQAALTGTRTEPAVRLRLVADEAATIDTLRDHLSTQAIPRMRQALEVDRLPALVQLTLRESGSRPRQIH